MTPGVQSHDVERFRQAIRHRLGLRFDETKLGFLAEVLERCAGRREHEPVPYLDRLERARSGGEETRQLARELTVGESYFFRNAEQLRAFAERALPERAAARVSGGVSLLSMGCSSGEEPYSLAILLRERLSSADVAASSILAADVNPSALEKARAARYSSWSLRETSAAVQQRWFRQDGRESVLDPGIRDSVRFIEHNLVEDLAEVWRPDAYDVVFCRNVLMYLEPELMQAVVHRIERSLVPGGYLFLGHAETLRGLSQDFHLCHTHETFYYQRKDTLSRPTSSTGWRPTAPVAMPLDVDLSQTSWVDAVQRASERIRSITEPRASTGVVGRPAPRGSPDLTVVMDLLRQERFSSALDLLGELPDSSHADPEVLLLRAVLLTHAGRLETAERVCAELLDLDELSAGAHYVLALCREGAGDRDGAAEHDRAAVYLDPSFAMPRLHLGLLARRAQDDVAARRELEQALTLLSREDGARLLLFGAGFGRDALVALCRAQLTASGGAP